jgi:hypothetical protein
MIMRANGTGRGRWGALAFGILGAVALLGACGGSMDGDGPADDAGAEPDAKSAAHQDAAPVGLTSSEAGSGSGRDDDVSEASDAAPSADADAAGPDSAAGDAAPRGDSDAGPDATALDGGADSAADAGHDAAPPVDSGPVHCSPVCLDKMCGNDGCGGSCGTCSANDSCDDEGQCVPACTTETVQLTNAVSNAGAICSDGATYTLPSEMYIKGTTGSTYIVSSGGWINDTIALGKSDTGTFQCCLTDPVGCAGYTQTCETASGGRIDCLCLAPKTWSVSATSCSTKVFDVCD